MRAKNLLHKAGLTTGACREEIVELLLASDVALSEQDIKERLNSSFDRTSIYRTFKTLLENNVIHAIHIDKGLVKYAINTKIKEVCQHTHFYCNQCYQVLCLDHLPKTEHAKPEGYHIERVETILKGTCKNCLTQQI